MAASASTSESLRSVLNDLPSGDGKEEYSIIHLAEDLDHQYANIPTGQIYKETMLSWLNFMKNYKIESVENSFSLQKKQYDVYLLTRNGIRMHMTEYDFLHVGLVQVFIRPQGLFLDRVGMDDRILVCLRDAKYPNLKESVLAAFEVSLKGDNTKFNWFPNFSSSLSDLANSNGLVITMEPHGFKLKRGFENSDILEITYRVRYKLMKGSLKPRSRFENPMLEVNTEKTKVLVAKPTSRNRL